mmetsp:Transcript_2764/g.10260  ORF Transcript_2764/g.10260 Transcript_2764/m.10260 type:complete len:219 (-) Transcript_2764:2106-2762(-)
MDDSYPVPSSEDEPPPLGVTPFSLTVFFPPRCAPPRGAPRVPFVACETTGALASEDEPSPAAAAACVAAPPASWSARCRVTKRRRNSGTIWSFHPCRDRAARRPIDSFRPKPQASATIAASSSGARSFKILASYTSLTASTHRSVVQKSGWSLTASAVGRSLGSGCSMSWTTCRAAATTCRGSLAVSSAFRLNAPLIIRWFSYSPAIVSGDCDAPGLV